MYIKVSKPVGLKINLIYQFAWIIIMGGVEIPASFFLLFFFLIYIYFSLQFLERYRLKFPMKVKDCAGTASAFDVHVDEIPDSEIQVLCDPIPILR